ncbi:thiamine-phosphate kinase [Propionivibrio soli]|uniref:thiamine-phosphate kinase n=1 Tax=Propionivibrio soli TaxID=2976531 RepID=UPI0021E794A0|nr:thiamine-phosphate kinase [Propionivibrio soli]
MSVSEFDLIARYFARATPNAVLGPGDDCALLAPSPGTELVVTTDMLVSGTHFFPDTNPRQLGWKTAAVNISDLAAMGAKPRWLLLAGSLPHADEAWIAAFAGGLFECTERYGVDLVGGDTTRGPLNFCITALGEVPTGSALRRDRAVAGDDIWVSGHPGMAALGLAHLQGRVSLPPSLRDVCIAALQQPFPRVELGRALREEGLARAAIDVSDGLLADLGHIAERSCLDAEVSLKDLPPLPLDVDAGLARECQLAGGDDYELVFTAPPASRDGLLALGVRLELPLWRIGRVIKARLGGGEVRLLDENGAVVPMNRRGFDHFGQDGE